MEHTGGNIYLDYELLPGGTSGITYGGSAYTVLTGSVTWGLYKITPEFSAVSVTIVEEDTTTSGGPNELDQILSPQLPIPNATVATFTIANLGEIDYNNVTITLTGVGSPSAPQTVNIPHGTTTPVTFSFTTPTTATTATLTFTDTILGEALPSVSFSLTEFLIIGTPTAAAEVTCPTTITKITIPVKNIGSLATASTTRFDITQNAYSGGGSTGLQLGSGCTTLAPGSVTFTPGAIASGATINLYIWCYNQPSGTLVAWQITPSLTSLTPGVNEPPIYEFTYTWP
jgi:hypothetical protein